MAYGFSGPENNGAKIKPNNTGNNTAPTGKQRCANGQSNTILKNQERKEANNSTTDNGSSLFTPEHAAGCKPEAAGSKRNQEAQAQLGSQETVSSDQDAQAQLGSQETVSSDQDADASVQAQPEAKAPKRSQEATAYRRYQEAPAPEEGASPANRIGSTKEPDARNKEAQPPSLQAEPERTPASLAQNLAIYYPALVSLFAGVKVKVTAPCLAHMQEFFEFTESWCEFDAIYVIQLGLIKAAANPYSGTGVDRFWWSRAYATRPAALFTETTTTGEYPIIRMAQELGYEQKQFTYAELEAEISRLVDVRRGASK